MLTGANSISDVKYLGLAKEFYLSPNIFWKLEVGYWADKRPGARPGLIIGPSLGLVIHPFKYFDLRVNAGIAGITQRDAYLGGPFQFTEEVFFGMREGTAFIGTSCWHVSSAGIFRPNIGRNFCALTAGYGF